MSSVVVNASTTARALPKKKIWQRVAAGRIFCRLFKEGRAGHADFKESLALIAHCMGWDAKNITETGDAVIADHDIRTQFLEVKKGLTCGLHQRAEAAINGKINLTLDIKMYLDAENPHDAMQIEGEPPLDVLIRGGVAGDQATVAAVINAVPRVLKARPGLLLMTDIALPCRT